MQILITILWLWTQFDLLEFDISQLEVVLWWKMTGGVDIHVFVHIPEWSRFLLAARRYV